LGRNLRVPPFFVPHGQQHVQQQGFSAACATASHRPNLLSTNTSGYTNASGKPLWWAIFRLYTKTRARGSTPKTGASLLDGQIFRQVYYQFPSHFSSTKPALKCFPCIWYCLPLNGFYSLPLRLDVCAHRAQTDNHFFNLLGTQGSHKAHHYFL
jgi:hypothetical protein